MIPTSELVLFAGAALLMVPTPGPNMMLIALFAARMASWFARNPLWLAVQRYFMGMVLGGLAVRLAMEERRSG